ncbi:MAG: isoprenylcysteine carboxylmethyltransferase family protein, partial [Verrucomicrobiota bacterium]
LAEPRAALLTIPSFLLCGLLFRWSQAEGASWSSFARWLFVVATGWTVVSLLCLGRSFAVIPSLRTVVTRGTYGWIRHPVYLGEMGLAGICAWATGHSGSGVLFMGVVIAVGWRIRVEEKFLSQESEEYSRYKEAVRWRLIPGAW